jgi:hypothetical protein
MLLPLLTAPIFLATTYLMTLGMAIILLLLILTDLLQWNGHLRPALPSECLG